MTTELTISEMKQEIERNIENAETLNTLMVTTFNGLQPQLAKRAMLEAMMRGFNFTDFLQKNVYAIPFRDGYSLVSSIDHARKIGMRSGVCGKSAPMLEEQDGKVISCTVTIKRMVQGVIGDYSATVYLSEYTTGRNLWQSKPRTMLCKVAEMHALRMACPEELSQVYVEDEYAQNVQVVVNEQESKEAMISEYTEKINSATSLDDLKEIWGNVPGAIRSSLSAVKDALKIKLSDGNFKLEPNENQ